MLASRISRPAAHPLLVRQVMNFGLCIHIPIKIIFSPVRRTVKLFQLTPRWKSIDFKKSARVCCHRRRPPHSPIKIKTSSYSVSNPHASASTSLQIKCSCSSRLGRSWRPEKGVVPRLVTHYMTWSSISLCCGGVSDWSQVEVDGCRPLWLNWNKSKLWMGIPYVLYLSRRENAKSFDWLVYLFWLIWWIRKYVVNQWNRKAVSWIRYSRD